MAWLNDQELEGKRLEDREVWEEAFLWEWAGNMMIFV